MADGPRRPAPHWGWWLTAGLLVVWAFVLGLLVGQGSLATPEQIAWLKQSTGLDRILAKDQQPGQAPLKDPELTFYRQVEDSNPRAAAAPVQPPATPAAKPEPAAQAAAAKPAPAEPAAKPVAAPQAISKAPPASEPPVGQARFIVQVASFQDQAQAEALVRRLKSGGHPAFLLPASVPGVGQRYRVRVGPYAELDAARGAASRIRLQHQLAAYVTRSE